MDTEDPLFVQGKYQLNTLISVKLKPSLGTVSDEPAHSHLMPYALFTHARFTYCVRGGGQKFM